MHRSHQRAFSLLLLFAALLVGGCETTPQSGSNPRLPLTASMALLRAGDGIAITIQGVPDAATHQVQIDDLGLVSLPLIGAIPAAERGAAVLAREIRQAYIDQRFYTAVDVAVTVTERHVYVGGEVARPGRVVWSPDLTLTKAIQSAGGFSLYARQRRVLLTREHTAYPFDVELAQRNPHEDPMLAPGDSIQVPRSAF